MRESKELIEKYIDSDYITFSKKEDKVRVKQLEMIGEPLRKEHKKYLIGRNFDPDFLEKKYKLTGTIYAPADFSYRLIIPIYYNRRLVSYQGRAITAKQDLRYKGLSPEKSVIPYKELLYGAEYAASHIGVVEGIFDQWRMGDGFVCTFGTDLTDNQIKLLSMYERIYFLYDSDAIRKARNYAKLLKSLNSNIKIEVIDLQLQDRDPGDLTESESHYLRRELNFL